MQQYTQCVMAIVISANPMMAKIEWEAVTNIWKEDINSNKHCDSRFTITIMFYV